MKRIKISLFFIYCCIALTSCNRNSLTQENAESTIREFLKTNSIVTSELEVSPATVRKIGKTNIYSQFYTNVKVEFNTINKAGLTLLFDFKRTPNNKWFLKSVEGVNGSLQEHSNWLKANKNLNIAAQ